MFYNSIAANARGGSHETGKFTCGFETGFIYPAMKSMKNFCQKILVFSFVLSVGVVAEIAAQTPQEIVSRRNSPFSPNPKRKDKKQEETRQIARIAQNSGLQTDEVKFAQTDFTQTETAEKNEPENLPATVEGKTAENVRRNVAVNALPTEIYRVGAGDVLDIRILNSPANGSTLFTVLEDGTIDYPLAGGEPVNVKDLTPAEIEILLAERVKLYEKPEISVTVRDYASHKISVLGLVERPGNKALRREAVPLYVILAEAIPLAGAEKVMIERGADRENVTVALADSETLIYPGDLVRVLGSEGKVESAQMKFYYIGGEIVSPGQKDFHDGITLTQAILASGGTRKASVRKVTLRRRNAEGLLKTTEFDLKAIKVGKIPDPQLEAGDIIEIGN
jgi:Periplasmic protein involved in polysaccharide export